MPVPAQKQMDNVQSELIIGMTQTVGGELRLRFETYQQACDASEAIDKGGIGRVRVMTAEGEAVVWCNYVAWVRCLRFASKPCPRGPLRPREAGTAEARSRGALLVPGC